MNEPESVKNIIVISDKNQQKFQKQDNSLVVTNFYDHLMDNKVFCKSQYSNICNYIQYLTSTTAL